MNNCLVEILAEFDKLEQNQEIAKTDITTTEPGNSVSGNAPKTETRKYMLVYFFLKVFFSACSAQYSHYSYRCTFDHVRSVLLMRQQ
jgi:hypothetical protein